jgi:hypothetical protein
MGINSNYNSGYNAGYNAGYNSEVDKDKKTSGYSDVDDDADSDTEASNGYGSVNDADSDSDTEEVGDASDVEESDSEVDEEFSTNTERDMGEISAKIKGLFDGEGQKKYAALMQHINSDTAKGYASLALKDQKTQIVPLNLLLEKKNPKFGKDLVVFAPNSSISLSVKTLGAGNYKTTFKVIRVATSNLEKANKLPKVKAFSYTTNSNLSAEEQQEQTREIAINTHLKSQLGTNLSHVQIPRKIISLGSSSAGISLQSNLCDGDLSKHKSMSEAEDRHICHQMALGVQEMHSVNLVHRDIKLDNFLFVANEDGSVKDVKIADFGKSQFQNAVDNKDEKIFFNISPPSNADRLNPAQDVYQLGTAMIMILNHQSFGEWLQQQNSEAQSKELPGVELTEKNLPKFITAWKKNPDAWGCLSSVKDEATRQMLRKMVDPNALQRPKMDEVVQFFQPIDQPAV